MERDSDYVYSDAINSAPSLKRKSLNKEWEIKLSILERAMDDKDNTIAQLWKKISLR